MSEIDDILSTIRNKTEDTQEISDIDYSISDDLSTENIIQHTNTPSAVQEEITSSFINTTKISIKKIDIKKLLEIKRKKENDYSIKKILQESALKINNYLITIVNKILIINNTTTIQLIDETEEIQASIHTELLKSKNIKIGTIIEINNFSLWNIKEKEINIVESNITTIYEEI